MTASMPSRSSSFWNRVLPAPPALLDGRNATESFPRRSCSLFPPQLSSPSNHEPQDSKERRSTISNASNGRRTSIANVTPCVESSFRLLDTSSRSEQRNTADFNRKRAASLMAADSRSRESSPTISRKSVSSNSDHFCLCQPDPKIPRPRNAFILYRQHHQAAVVDKNPGLPNPEISKVIGEEWRALPPETKNQWKSLAEAEKTRHQQQYPDYRYQPRRVGRNTAASTSPTSGGIGPGGNCLRCGGKTMHPPATPQTPGFSPHEKGMVPINRSSTNGGPSTMIGARRPHPLGPAGSYRQAPYTVPSPPLTVSGTARMRHFGDGFANGLPGGSTETGHRARYGTAHPMSPSPKRRRYHGPGVMVPARAPEMATSTAMYPPRTTYSPRGLPTSRMPDTPLLSARQSSPTHQLQRANATGPPNGQFTPVGARDTSLTLPPLKTSESMTKAAGLNAQPQSHTAESAETLIMSISVLQKLRLLAKAAPPLPHPGAMTTQHKSLTIDGSSSLQSRGAILAIEGSEDDVREMSGWLADFLHSQNDGFDVRSFPGPDISTVLAKGQSESASNAVCTQQQRYLKAISEWHGISQQVVNFVTHIATPVPKDTPCNDDSTALPDKLDWLASEKEKPTSPRLDPGFDVSGTAKNKPESDQMDVDTASVSSATSSVLSSAVSPRTITQTRKLSLHSQQEKDETARVTGVSAGSTAASSTAKNPNLKMRFPIAIIPRYQLSTVDTASLSMPITDAYPPTDHWQWAAALWRGCVGADVTIVIQDPNKMQSSPGSGSNGSGGTGIGRQGGVEVRLGTGDVRSVIVEKASQGRSDDGSEKLNGGPAVGAGQLRRVGFEVAEFLRK